MKKIILAIIMFMAIPLYASNTAVFKSSYTTTNDTTQEITNGSDSARYFYGVVVGSATAGGYLLIYDSQGAVSSQVANLNLGSVGGYVYNIHLSSGLTYTSNTATNGVTIIYK